MAGSESRLTYCPTCAGKLALQPMGDYDDALHPVCEDCGFVLWQSPKPTVDALVLRYEDDRETILLGRRAHEPSRGQWDTPGGFMNAGEQVEDVVRRECRREFGVEVEIEGIVGAFDDHYLDAPTVALVYACRYRSGHPRPLGPPVDEVRWSPATRSPRSASK